uniref:hypothetical protein n=1 Tax=Actinacidiphila soli TaxID=2487275 RepID=UPI0013E3EA04
MTADDHDGSLFSRVRAVAGGAGQTLRDALVPGIVPVAAGLALSERTTARPSRASVPRPAGRLRAPHP